MKTKYKYLLFEPRGERAWVCLNKRGVVLGYVDWYPPWRQYVFSPTAGTEYSQDCLRDIADFLEQLKENYHDSKGINPTT